MSVVKLACHWCGTMNPCAANTAVFCSKCCHRADTWRDRCDCLMCQEPRPPFDHGLSNLSDVPGVMHSHPFLEYPPAGDLPGPPHPLEELPDAEEIPDLLLTTIAEVDQLRAENARLKAEMLALVDAHTATVAELREDVAFKHDAYQGAVVQLNRSEANVVTLVKHLRELVESQRCEEGHVPDKRQMRRNGRAIIAALELLKLYVGIG